MLKEIFSDKKVKIAAICIAVIIFALIVILCASAIGGRSDDMLVGLEQTLAKSFGKGVGFPGKAYNISNGEVSVFIENDTNTYFLVGDKSEGIDVASDTCTEAGKDYQRFRVNLVNREEVQEDSSETQVSKLPATSEHFTLVNVPRGIAFEVMLKAKDGKITVSKVATDKKYKSSENDEVIAEMKSKYGDMSILDKSVIINVREYDLNRDPDNSLIGYMLTTYYKDKYLSVFATEGANQQKVIDSSLYGGELTNIMVKDISVSVIKGESSLRGVFTFDGVSYLVNGADEEAELTGFIKMLLK